MSMNKDPLSLKERKHARELEAKSTQVNAWYPHSQYDGYHHGKASVRGPFGRWLLVEGGDNGMDQREYPTPVADLYDDAKYAAEAMNNYPRALNDLDSKDATIVRLRNEIKGSVCGECLLNPILSTSPGICKDCKTSKVLYSAEKANVSHIMAQGWIAGCEVMRLMLSIDDKQKKDMIKIAEDYETVVDRLNQNKRSG